MIYLVKIYKSFNKSFNKLINKFFIFKNENNSSIFKTMEKYFINLYFVYYYIYDIIEINL